MGFMIDIFQKLFYYTIDGPVTAARNFIEWQRSKRTPSYYYHREFRRVTPIEDCRMDDFVCRYEAFEQYRRDKMVEEEIIKILKQRVSKCSVEEGPSAHKNCKQVLADYDTAADAFEVKYGELGSVSSPLTCMMRQKYRVYYERKKAQQKQQTESEE